MSTFYIVRKSGNFNLTFSSMVISFPWMARQRIRDGPIFFEMMSPPVKYQGDD
jgi:hypothetical protein